MLHILERWVVCGIERKTKMINVERNKFLSINQSIDPWVRVQTEAASHAVGAKIAWGLGWLATCLVEKGPFHRSISPQTASWIVKTKWK